jgi:CMP-N-acetylneuraminic acid synthetase
MKILAVIPARGGSKGVPRKNIRPLAGKPLIAYSIETALAVRDLLYRVVVSTDDAEIAAVARAHGAEVPFMRPAELAHDKAPQLPVLQHAARTIEEQDGVTLDWVLLLQPTAPLRTPDDVRAAIALGIGASPAETGPATSVISVVQVFAVHPILMKRIEHGALVPYCIEEREGTRRQDYDPPAYMRNGAIYFTRRDVLMGGSIWGGRIVPYVMPEERSVSIDSLMDWRLLEAVLSERGGEDR